MKRRLAIAGIGALFVAACLWGTLAIVATNDVHRPQAPSRSAPADAAGATLASGRSVGVATGRAGPVSVEESAVSESPLFPDGPPTAFPSAVRRVGRRWLWTDNSEGVIGLTSEFARFPADGLSRGTAALAVSVIDAAGDPVDGAEVSIEPPAPAEEYGTDSRDTYLLGATDAAGTLRVESLPAGPAVVRLSARSLSAACADLVREITLTSARDLVLTVRLDRSARDFGVVVGRVVDAEGLPPRWATVRVRGTDVRTQTEADGTFRLAGVPVGRAAIETYPSGCDAVALEVDVRPGVEVRADFRAAYADDGPREIRGRVVNSAGGPVPGVRVGARRLTEMIPFRWATSDATGRFVLRRLSDAALEAGVGVSVDDHGADLVDTEPEVKSGTIATEVTIVTSARRVSRATFSVRVIDAETSLSVRRCLALVRRDEAAAAANDSPTAPDPRLVRARRPRPELKYECQDFGARLWPPGRERPFRTSREALSGRLLEALLEPGRYRLRVVSPEYATWEGTIDVAAPPQETPVAEVRLVRRRGPVEDVALGVVVLTPSGVKLHDARVEVLDPLDGSRLSASDRSAEDGRFRLPALSGDWRLRVTAEGFLPFERAMRLPEADPEPTITVHLERK